MPRKKRQDTEIEQDHGHCADVLIKDYGVPKKYRIQVCEEIAKVWHHELMFHDYIIWSVRGYMRHHLTRPLEDFLNKYRTHPPLNHKQNLNPTN